MLETKDELLKIKTSNKSQGKAYQYEEYILETKIKWLEKNLELKKNKIDLKSVLS